jgi:hypothetical protein
MILFIFFGIQNDGHSNIETTMVYLHLTLKRRNSLISPLDAMLKIEPPKEEKLPKIEVNEGPTSNE